MEEGVNGTGSPGIAEVAFTGSKAEVASEILWYPVGILLGLLATAGVLLFCIPGRWIG